MDARSFIIAVGPVVAAEVVVGIGHELLSPTEDFALHNISTTDWLVLAVSFLVFPLWAGARVARVTSTRRWYALGGASVLLGTLVAGAFSELLNPSPIGSSWLFVFVALLIASPFYAFLGFMGGAFQRLRAGHGA